MEWGSILMLVLALTLSHPAVGIKFNYNASKHEYICFQEQVEKQTRYQVIVKSDKPSYFLQVFEEDISVYQDEREQAYIKYYSAFSKVQGLLLACLANQDYENETMFQIQIYHGSHLEGLLDEISSDSFSQMEDMYGQCLEMQAFVKRAYQMNVETLLQRNRLVGTMQMGVTVATLAFFLVLALSRGMLVARLRKIMRARKLI